MSTKLDWLRIRYNDRFCEHGNEPPGFIKGGELLVQPRDYHVLMKDSTK